MADADCFADEFEFVFVFDGALHHDEVFVADEVFGVDFIGEGAVGGESGSVFFEAEVLDACFFDEFFEDFGCGDVIFNDDVAAECFVGEFVGEHFACHDECLSGCDECEHGAFGGAGEVACVDLVGDEQCVDVVLFLGGAECGAAAFGVKFFLFGLVHSILPFVDMRVCGLYAEQVGLAEHADLFKVGECFFDGAEDFGCSFGDEGAGVAFRFPDDVDFF